MNRRAKIAIVVGVVCVATILLPVIHHYQLKAEVNAYIAQLKAQGEPMDLAQVIPPPVPADQNDAPSLLQAASMIETNWEVLSINPPLAMQMVAPGKAMIRWQQSDIRSSDGINSWDDLQQALAKDNYALNVVQKITNRPQLDFNLDYASGSFRMMHVDPIRSVMDALSADALLDLHRGDTDSAIRDIHAMLLTANAMQHDRVLISEFTRIAFAYRAWGTTWEILQATNVTDRQLAALQHGWMVQTFLPSLENTTEMGRELERTTLARWRASTSELPKVSGYPVIPVYENFRIFKWQYLGSYSDELCDLKGYQVLVDAIKSAETNSPFFDSMQFKKNLLAKLGIPEESGGMRLDFDGNYHELFIDDITYLSGAITQGMYMEATKQMMVTAIALKRYQLKYGKYPTDLSSLVPEFMPGIPLDLVDGKSLRYRLNSDGMFLLYSVGENGRDDGGDASSDIRDQSSYVYWPMYSRDWVWPQPATAEEVQKYYANLGKQN